MFLVVALHVVILFLLYIGYCSECLQKAHPIYKDCVKFYKTVTTKKTTQVKTVCGALKENLYMKCSAVCKGWCKVSLSMKNTVDKMVREEWVNGVILKWLSVWISSCLCAAVGSTMISLGI